MSYSQNKTDIKDTIAYRHGAQSEEERAKQEHLTESSSNLHSEFDELTKEATEKFEYYKKTGKLLSHQATGITQLAITEAKLTASAYTRIFKLVAILAPIAFIFYLSICVCIGAITYSVTQSILITSGIFLAFQAAIVGAIMLTIKSTTSYIGFDKTKQQIKELKNELSNLF